MCTMRLTENSIIQEYRCCQMNMSIGYTVQIYFAVETYLFHCHFCYANRKQECLLQHSTILQSSRMRNKVSGLCRIKAMSLPGLLVTQIILLIRRGFQIRQHGSTRNKTKTKKTLIWAQNLKKRSSLNLCYTECQQYSVQKCWQFAP